MKTLIKTIICILSISSLISCDQIDSDIIANYGKEINTAPPDTGTGEDTTTEVRMRKVLVEDFTGHTCPNCPRAATELKTLETLYGEKIVAIALHVSNNFAEPQPPTYTADYRTPEGTEIDDFFNVSLAGLPKGMVNRRFVQGSRIISYQSWGSEIGSFINTPLDAWISMTNTYNASQNKVTTDLMIDFENSINDEVKLCVFLVQDSIISPQKDLDSPTGKVIDYVHMHMLRKALTSAFGESIITNPTADTPEISKSYSLVLSADQIPEHCKIVAYIYKASTYEIIQVQEKHVK
jgi:thiol-disulfide isomerase/thioredoxin